jgi:hypothetical protein
MSNLENFERMADSDRDYMTIACHCLFKDDLIKARFWMNKLSNDYFPSKIYKDLFESLVFFNKYKEDKLQMYLVKAEFYLLVKHNLDKIQEKLEFRHKEKYLLFLANFFGN